MVVIDRCYPSSKTCSCCRYKREALDLAIREWTCPECGALHDRDINAAINLRNMAVSFTVSACGACDLCVDLARPRQRGSVAFAALERELLATVLDATLLEVMSF